MKGGEVVVVIVVVGSSGGRCVGWLVSSCAGNGRRSGK